MNTNIDLSQAARSTRMFREKLLADPYRPGYHFTLPDDIGIPGDPNGAFFANGRYHLMYLYNRSGQKNSLRSCFCWGHISSSDLIHWRHHPDAIVPGGGDGGCFSGGAFVDDDGTAYLSYWALPANDNSAQGTGIGIYRSCDRNYEQWEKIALIAGTSAGILEAADEAGQSRYLANADPSNIWKKDGFYYLQAGNKPVLDKYGQTGQSAEIYRGDWVDLFRSEDLINWQYGGRFYQRKTDDRWTDATEDDMCPSFLPLPVSPDGGPASGKHLQLFISHNKGCQYYIGEYDQPNDRFLPQAHGRMTWADNTFFAPEALIDNHGRQIMWAWLLDNPEPAAVETSSKVLGADGWSGVYGLPRSLWLADDGTLGIAPVKELEQLRINGKSFPAAVINDGRQLELTEINGQSCEIILEIISGTARKIGLKVRTSPDEAEVTLLYVDIKAEHLVFDSTRSGVHGRLIKEAAPFQLGATEKLQLHIFIDQSVVEIFANNRQAITRRVYPGRSDSRSVILFCADGEATFCNIQTWEIMPANPY